MKTHVSVRMWFVWGALACSPLGGCDDGATQNGASKEDSGGVAAHWDALLASHDAASSKACSCDQKYCEQEAAPPRECAIDALKVNEAGSLAVLGCLERAADEAADCIGSAECTDSAKLSQCDQARKQAIEACPQYPDDVAQRLAECAP